jgi:hypothetical protein
MTLQAWCRQQLRWLDSDTREPGDLTIYDDCKVLLGELKAKATEAVLPDVIRVCKGTTPQHLREALWTCIGIIQPTSLTPPQAARRLGCKPAVILAAIHSGRLKAMNLSRGPERPRYRISISDLEAMGKITTAAKPRRVFK